MNSTNQIIFYVNGKKQQVSGANTFIPLADYLRNQIFLTGTKVVCAEGDCGSCTVLKATANKNRDVVQFRSMNACIAFVFQLHGSHIITVEVQQIDRQTPNEIQQSMIDNFGSQCGYCTPGFINSLADLFENEKEITRQRIKNYCTGNLCRCTGYQNIVRAIEAAAAEMTA